MLGNVKGRQNGALIVRAVHNVDGSGSTLAADHVPGNTYGQVRHPVAVEVASCQRGPEVIAQLRCIPKNRLINTRSEVRIAQTARAAITEIDESPEVLTRSADRQIGTQVAVEESCRQSGAELLIGN